MTLPASPDCCASSDNHTTQPTLPEGGAEIPMSEKTYPYTAWALMPSYKLKQVEIVAPYYRDTHVCGETGKVYAVAELRESMEEIIAYGREQIARRQKELDKKQESLRKHAAALDKAERE